MYLITKQKIFGKSKDLWFANNHLIVTSCSELSLSAATVFGNQ